jgi:ABC-type branched-subunit amino acid transport system ATPase component/branched-subunit amino acid ABC-type transport system permease component
LDKFLTLTVSGLITGAIYSLVAAGVTLSFTATGIFNFAYGAIAYVSAVTFFELNTALGWPIVPAALVTLLVVAPTVGLVLDSVVFRRLTNASPAARVVAPVGLMIALPAATRYVIDGLANWFEVDLIKSSQLNSVGFPSGVGPVPRKEWRLPGGASLDSNQLALLLVAVVCAVGLWVLMRHMHVGLRMRAVVDSASLARLRGIDSGSTSRLAWMIGCTLAGLAGVFGAPVLGSLSANSYVSVQFVASAAAVLGGLRSIPLAALGGVLLGVAQNLVFGYATFASDIQGFNTSVPFVFLLAGLVVMNRDRRRSGGTASDDGEAASLGRIPFPKAFTATVSILFLFWLFVLADDYWVGVSITGLALAIVLLSFVVVTGLGGMVSLAQATFVSAAGLMTGLLLDGHGWPFVPAAAVGVLFSVVLGVVVALPALRLGGVPLALATLALAFVGDTVLFQWDPLRNEQTGWTFHPPVLGPLDLGDRKVFAVVLVVLIVACVAFVRNLERSATGRAIVAVRGSALAASTSGHEPARVKLIVFAASAGIAGLGGVMLATANRSATNLSYPATVGLLWLAQVVLFGVRRPGTAVAAGISAAIFPELLRSGFHWPSFVPTWLAWDGTRSAEIAAILFGLGAVAVAQNPDGFLSVYALMFRRREQRRAARVASSAAAGVEVDLVADTPAVPSIELATASPPAVVDGAAATVRGLVAGYGDIEVLHGVDLTLQAGAVNVLLGPNGSGKTTVARALAGLIPATGGQVVVAGVDVLALPPHRRSRDGLVLVPQDRGVFPGLSVDENLRVRLRDKEGRLEAYERFPALARRADTHASSLSGGEQQQLSLASIVVHTPRVVIVDEPTLGLAPQIAADVLHTVEELAAAGATVLLIEEKPQRVLAIAGRAALLSLGRVVWEGDPADLDPALLESIYLGRSSAETDDGGLEPAIAYDR